MSSRCWGWRTGLLLDPQILLIDELSLGLAPVVVQQLLAIVEQLKEAGLTMVIVEQSINVALAVADRAVFMEKGEVRFEGAGGRPPRARRPRARRVPRRRGRMITAPVIAVAIGSWDISVEIVIIGVLTGLTYAVLAAGLVLVYRATRVINFAHGEIGAFGAALLAKLVLDEHWNFFLTLPLVLVLGGVMGAAIELGIVRRLFKAPRVVVMVATIGVSQLALVAQLLLPSIDHPGRYPSPIDRTLRVGTLVLSSEHFMIIAFVPASIVGLVLFLNRTPYGIAIRAAAVNPDRAELAGISTKRVSTLVWVIAGVLSTLTAVLINPVRGTIVGVPSQALGPSLLLRALAAGLFGGLTSVSWALVGGVAIGVVEAILFVNVTQPRRRRRVPVRARARVGLRPRQPGGAGGRRLVAHAAGRRHPRATP